MQGLSTPTNALFSSFLSRWQTALKQAQKYVFAMFLYSINGLLVSQSLNWPTIEKYLPYGSSLSFYLAIEKALTRGVTSSEAFSWCTSDRFKSFDLFLTNSGALIFETNFTQDKQHTQMRSSIQLLER